MAFRASFGTMWGPDRLRLFESGREACGEACGETCVMARTTVVSRTLPGWNSSRLLYGKKSSSSGASEEESPSQGKASKLLKERKKVKNLKTIEFLQKNINMQKAMKKLTPVKVGDR
jgi:hypothetical protein